MGKTRFKRLIELITFIQSNVNVSIYDIMNELNISRSTAFRDLSLIESCGVPYSYDPTKGYRICSSYMLPVNDLTTDDCIALANLYTKLRKDIQDPTAEQAVKAFQKLLALLPQSMRDLYDHSSSPHITVVGQRVFESDKIKQNVSFFLEAIEKRRPLMCELQKSSNGRKQVRLHPYHLMTKNSEWYVWGKIQPAGILKSIPLDEILRPVMTENRFHKPADEFVYAWQEAWCVKPEGILYDVELEFTYDAPQSLISRTWHHSQKKAMHDSGQMMIRFKVDGLDEIADWVWQYHRYLRVLKPKELKNRLQLRAQELL